MATRSDLSSTIRWLSGLFPGTWKMQNKGTFAWAIPGDKAARHNAGWWAALQGSLASKNLRARIEESTVARSSMVYSRLAMMVASDGMRDSQPAMAWYGLQKYLAKYRYVPLARWPVESDL